MISVKCDIFQVANEGRGEERVRGEERRQKRRGEKKRRNIEKVGEDRKRREKGPLIHR